jgi:hypothetical protein
MREVFRFALFLIDLFLIPVLYTLILVALPVYIGVVMGEARGLPVGISLSWFLMLIIGGVVHLWREFRHRDK